MSESEQERDQTVEWNAASVIGSLLEQFDARYVFPDAAARLRGVLEQRLSNDDYASIEEPETFAALLTEQLYEILKDIHVRVYYVPDKRVGPDDDRRKRRDEFLRRSNYAFRRVERLSGNIGYLELAAFVDLSEPAKAVVCAAMTFLAHTDALIIDLRKNGGGSPEMVAYLTSYLFTEEPVHLNSLYWRPTDRTEEFWTHREVLGPRYGIDKPVYVLMSKNTFSGAEEFAYNLKALKKALLVGEVTGGGAHPGEEVSVFGNFYAWISTGRAINPYTNTNWEGIGVTPDVRASPAEALTVAHLNAVDTLLASQPPEDVFKELLVVREELLRHGLSESDAAIQPTQTTRG